jgi:hypothetical protein
VQQKQDSETDNHSGCTTPEVGADRGGEREFSLQLVFSISISWRNIGPATEAKANDRNLLEVPGKEAEWSGAEAIAMCNKSDLKIQTL